VNVNILKICGIVGSKIGGAGSRSLEFGIE